MTRTVRFCLNDGPAAGADGPPMATGRHNSYAAWPAMRGLGRYYELDVTCRGPVDPQTGYFINIKRIDEAVRDHVLPDLESLLASSTRPAAMMPMGQLMQRMVNLLHQPLGGAVWELAMRLTPRHSLTIRSRDMSHLTIRQQYEFSAAHRLHLPELSDEENQRLFGKCNNPAGHGHNYRLEVAVRAPIDEAGQVFPVEELDALVDRVVIQKLDHKHLNLDVPQFARLNPSVEHIAQVIWQMLAGQVGQLGSVEGASLEEVRVWETEKTVCTYRGEERAEK